VDAWLDSNVVTGAQSVHPDAPPQQRVWVAHTTVRKKGSAPAQGSCKWILPEAPRSLPDSEEPEGSHLAVGSDAPSTSATSAESESQTPCRAESFYRSADLEMLEPYPEATPEDELRQLWALPRVKQGFWPEVGNCQNSHGCICWRCWHDCKIEIPLHVMVPVWDSEWERAIVGNEYQARRPNRWDDLRGKDVKDQEEEEAYNEADFEHLMVYNANAGTYLLTIHPEMGLTHVHTQMEYPTGSPSEEVRTKLTGYFMALTPEEGGNEEEHAIEGLQVEWGEGITTTVKALVRNPKLRYQGSKLGTRHAYTAKTGHRVYRHRLDLKKVKTPYHTDPRSPGTPHPANSARTVARVRHKDVTPRATKPVNQTVTRDILRLLNMLGTTKKFEKYNHRYGVYKLTQLDPQPHIGNGTVTGTRWLHNHQARMDWNAAPSVSTQTPESADDLPHDPI
jgi:hypothetical protein